MLLENPLETIVRESSAVSFHEAGHCVGAVLAGVPLVGAWLRQRQCATGKAGKRRVAFAIAFGSAAQKCAGYGTHLDVDDRQKLKAVWKSSDLDSLVVAA